MDPVLESPSIGWPMEKSTAVADGVGGGERLTTAAANATETPGATVGATKSSEAGARATNIALESGAGRPMEPEE